MHDTKEDHRLRSLGPQAKQQSTEGRISEKLFDRQQTELSVFSCLVTGDLKPLTLVRVDPGWPQFVDLTWRSVKLHSRCPEDIP